MCWSRYATFNGPNGCGDRAYMGYILCNAAKARPGQDPCVDDMEKLRDLPRVYLPEDQGHPGPCPECRFLTPESSWNSGLGEPGLGEP